MSLFSGAPANPPSDDFIMRNSGDAQQIEIGWWPGDARYPRAAFFGFASPAPEGFGERPLAPPARWDARLGEYVLDWDDVITTSDPHASAVAFGRSVVAQACTLCDWDPVLSASAQGIPPPVH